MPAGRENHSEQINAILLWPESPDVNLGGYRWLMKGLADQEYPPARLLRKSVFASNMARMVPRLVLIVDGPLAWISTSSVQPGPMQQESVTFH